MAYDAKKDKSLEMRRAHEETPARRRRVLDCRRGLD